MAAKIVRPNYDYPIDSGYKFDVPLHVGKKAQNNQNNILSINELQNLLKNFNKKPAGIYSTPVIKAAGFHYRDDGTLVCDKCDLQVNPAQFTSEIKPYHFHAKARPDCPYVLSMKPSIPIVKRDVPSVSSLPTSSDMNENPSKRQKIESTDSLSTPETLFETNTLQQVRKRTFSHWPHRTSPSKEQMIEAGFFSCNVGDRVICIYCNLICQQWTPHADDPCQVHTTLSPRCVYVISKLIRRESASLVIVNDNTGTNGAQNVSSISNASQPFRSHGLVHTVACHTAYIDIPRRYATYSSWPTDNLPSVDDLVKAGFFYSGSRTIVTCFYCNGSLQNWGANDNPMIEHARWFPQCAYAKQLCGDDLYRKIQESKRAQLERMKLNEARENNSSAHTLSAISSNSSLKLQIPDDSTLSRLVAARLDLPISQSLLGKPFKLSIIKRCWEDQLRLKLDDFESDCDLRIACVILQKQIEYIDGKKENIVVPSIKMKQKNKEREERERSEALLRQQERQNPNGSIRLQEFKAESTNDHAMETSVSSQSETNESAVSTDSTASNTAAESQTDVKPSTDNSSSKPEQKSTKEVTLNNPCVICLEAEKGLACIPCGHLATCVPCGHSMRTCPICRRDIEAYVRIYV